MRSEESTEGMLLELPRSLVRHTKHPRIFLIKGWTGGMRREQEDHRRRFVDRLRQLLPFTLVWLNDLNEDVAASLGSAVSKIGKTGFWPAPAGRSLNRLLDELYRGGWAMFFFSQPPLHLPELPPVLPTEPEEVASMVGRMGASAAILSWYDDIEWIVAFSSETKA